MIERIPDLPDHVLGFSAKGKVTAEDYEKVLIPAVEKELKENKKIRFLYNFGKDSKVSRRAQCGRIRKSAFRISRRGKRLP